MPATKEHRPVASIGSSYVVRDGVGCVAGLRLGQWEVEIKSWW